MSDATSDQPGTVSDHGAPTTVATVPVSVEQAAAILGVSVTTVRRRIRAGTLRAEEARRPQGPVWLVYLPADATPPTTSDQAGATVVATAPTTAGDAMIAYTQTLLGPLVAALERAQTRNAELERAVGRLQAENDALRASQTQQGANLSVSGPEPAQEPSAPAEPVSAPWWRRWWAAVSG